jgi:prophage regulatory protein
MTYQQLLIKYKDDPDGLSLIRMPTVEKDSGLKRSAIYKLISEGSFPQPIKLTTRSSAWIKAEVKEWIARRIEESRNQAKVGKL